MQHAVFCAVCGSEGFAVSQPISYAYWCTMVGAVDAAVRCAERRAICGTMQHAVCFAVCVSWQRVVSQPIRYTFGCTMVHAVDAAVRGAGR